MSIFIGKHNRLLIGTSSVIFSLCFVTQLLGRQGQVASAQLIPRKILALYKGSENRTEEVNEIYQLAQLPLNNLGLVVEYADAEQELPTPEEMSEYRGILTWFISDQMKNVRRYRHWLNRILTAGRLPVVMMGHMGAYREYGRKISNLDVLEVKSIFNLMGLTSNLRTWKAENVHIDFKNSAFYDFELNLSSDKVDYFYDIRSKRQNNRVLLRLSQNGVRNDAAILTPNGGYIQNGVIYRLDEESGRMQWYVNPFLFFRTVFACDNFPIVDINTLGGKRTAFVHIDGDGFSTISKIDRWHLCAQLMQKRVFEKYRLPFSVSVIVAEVDSAYLGNEETVQTARRLFRLPNVEPASHGFAHPFDWRTGKVELDSIPGYQFDAKREIVESMHYIQQQLLPPGKSVNVFFWTGMCNPTAEQIQIVEDHGWYQINGGAGKLDPMYPSISAFAPPYAQVKNQFRINARISNEYEFSDRWLKHYDGFVQVVKSLYFTGQRNPLTPANIYFHFYSMEWPQSWAALRKVLQFAEHQDWTFLYVSQYIRMVNDFLHAEIFLLDEDKYVVRSNGFVRTIRFLTESRGINLAESKNVLGFAHQGRDLLVHLNANQEHLIVLGRTLHKIPYLSGFNRMIDSVSVMNDTLQLTVQGFGNFKAVLRNMLPDQAYLVKSLTEFEPERQHNAKRCPVISSQFGKENLFYVHSQADGTLKLKAFIEGRTVLIITPATTFQYVLAKFRPWILGLILLGFVGVHLRWVRTRGRKI